MTEPEPFFGPRFFRAISRVHVKRLCVHLWQVSVVGPAKESFSQPHLSQGILRPSHLTFLRRHWSHGGSFTGASPEYSVSCSASPFGSLFTSGMGASEVVCSIFTSAMMLGSTQVRGEVADLAIAHEKSVAAVVLESKADCHSQHHAWRKAGPERKRGWRCAFDGLVEKVTLPARWNMHMQGLADRHLPHCGDRTELYGEGLRLDM